MNSTSFNFDFRIDKSDSLSIKEHLLSCDKLFEPPLSSYVNIHVYSKKLFNKATNFEAWHSDKLIGLVSVYINDLKSRVAYVSNVSVNADYQNRGIASILLSKAVAHSSRLGFLCIKLEVYSWNIKAIALYSKLGFKEDDLNNEKLTMVKYF